MAGSEVQKIKERVIKDKRNAYNEAQATRSHCVWLDVGKLRPQGYTIEISICEWKLIMGGNKGGRFYVFSVKINYATKISVQGM